jgi:hypothetical protein
MRVDAHVHSQTASLRPQQAKNNTKEIKTIKREKNKTPHNKLKGKRGRKSRMKKGNEKNKNIKKPVDEVASVAPGRKSSASNPAEIHQGWV